MAPPKRPWFRFYVEAVHDRKLRRLKPETRWLFVACLAAARQSPTPGHLLVAHTDPMTWEDLMDFAGMTRKQIEEGMDALQDAGVVALDGEAWFIPNWNDRQYESDDVTSRTRKHRSGNGNGTAMERSEDENGTFDGTPPETEDRKTEAEGVSRTFHDLLPPGASPTFLAELDQIIDALIVVYGEQVDVAVLALLDRGVRFQFPSKVRQALEAGMTPPASVRPSAFDAAQEAQRALMTRSRDCPACSGSGWADPDADGVVLPCATCRPEDARFQEAS